MRKTMKCFTAICCAGLLLTGTVSVMASTQDDLIAAQQEQEATVASILSIQDRIESIEAKKGKTEEYLEELTTQVTELTSELEGIQEQCKAKLQELDSASMALANAELDESEQRKNMKLRIQYMYENSQDAGMLESLFSSDDFSEFLTRATTMMELTEFDRQMLENYEQICDEVEARKKQVEAENNEVQKLRDQCSSKREEMVVLRDSTDAEVKELAKDLEDQEGKAAELLAQYQSQEELIATLTMQASAEVAAANYAYYTAYASPSGGGSGSGGSSNPGSSSDGASEAVSSSSGETESSSPASSYVNTSTWDGPVLNRVMGVNQGPTGKETYYNLNMSYVVEMMRDIGNYDEYWVRDDGVKMLGDYVMVAANYDSHPRGSLVESSLGTAVVCDTGTFAASNPEQLDIAVAW